MPNENSTPTQDTNPIPPVVPPVPPVVPPAPPTGMHYSEAYQRALPTAKALDAAELVTINIDVPTAVTTAVGAMQKIMAFRDRIAKELPSFDVTHLDELQTYTLATGHAHAMYSAASAPPEAIQALNEQGLALRDLMYSDAVALSNRGLISGDKLSEFKTNVGYKNLAFDLLGLSVLLRNSWSAIASKTAVTSRTCSRFTRSSSMSSAASPWCAIGDCSSQLSSSRVWSMGTASVELHFCLDPQR